MISYYKTVASSVPDDCSVYLYNIPQCSANDISVPVADFLASTMKNIVGIKYSYPDFNVFKEYVLCHDKEFDVICGPDQLFLPALSIGCKGVVAGCGNCDPVPFVKVYKAFESGDMEGAKTAQEQANDLAKIIKGCAILSYVKYGAHYNGIPLSHMRAPAMDIGEAEVKKMYAELDAYYFKYGKEL
jgi:4-hydroxy-tetrahydrodipicolinate synthase